MNIILSYTETRTDALLKTLKYSYTFSNCTFRYPTDIMSPTIRLNVNTLKLTISGNEYNLATDFNYVFIGELDKFYFIQNVSIISNNIVDIYLQIDPLASYRTKIRDLSCIINRNESTYDTTIVDDKCNFKNVLNVEYITPTNTLVSNDKIDSGTCCVLMTIYATQDAWSQSQWLNDDAFSMPIYTENPSVGPNKKQTPVNCFRNQRNSTYTLVLSSLEYYYMMGYLATSATLLTYVKNVRIIPVSASYVGYEGSTYAASVKSSNVPIGDQLLNFYTLVGMPEQYLRLLYSPFYVFNEFGFDFDTMINNSSLYYYVGHHDWLLKKPYSVIKLFLPYYGYVELNYDYCKGQTLKVYYYIDPETDDDYLMIIRSSDNKIIFKDSVEISMNIPLNYDNTYENKVLKQDAKNTFALNGVTGELTTFLGGLQMIAGAMLIGTGIGGPIGSGLVLSGGATFASGIANTVKASVTYQNTVNELFDQSNQRTGTGLGGKIDSDDVFVRIESYIPTDEYGTSKYAETVGYPLGQVKTLSALSGFTMCSNFTLDFGNSLEKEYITQALINGIYIN